MKPYKITPVNLVLLVTLALMLGFIASLYLLPERGNGGEVRIVPNVTAEGRRAELLIPAVDVEGNGVTGKLVTTVRPGSGLVLVGVNNVLAQYDTQYSGRVAAFAAARHEQIDLADWDIVYDIQVNATAIEGPSAGASMAVSIIAALENKTIDPTVSITGVVHEDGSIEGAGAILEKALAAREQGVRTFLVASGQSVETAYLREKTCEPRMNGEYCRIEYVKKEANLSDRLDMTIVEVRNVAEALPYMLKS